MKSQLMYIELKTDGLRGVGRIGRVEFSKTRQTLYYKDRILEKAKGRPLKANYFDTSSLEDFWISAPKKDGRDALFATVVEIDEDAREEYWVSVRNAPSLVECSSYRCLGVTKQKREALEKGLRRRQMDNRWMPK